jgi:hypothetical protein
MSRQSGRFISPVWAKRIEVERNGDSLLVTGWERVFGPVDAREIPYEDASKLDIFRRLNRYSLLQLGTKRDEESSSVYQFADANSDEKLIAFVREFGPVFGEVFSTGCSQEGILIALTVDQSLSKLRRQREIFWAATKLLQELNRSSKADPRNILAAMTRILPKGMRPPEGFPETDHCLNFKAQYPVGHKVMSYPIAVRFSALAIELWCTTGVPLSDKKDATIRLAQRVLCDLLNQHRPFLVPIEGELIELPEIPNEGILDALYFQLRLDFLAQRQIGTCLHCGNHFPVFRRGAKGCSAACRTALRNNKYWVKHKKVINQKRRKKSREGK